jgi:DNA-directed RNA polymerase specialized sigma24 family protein
MHSKTHANAPDSVIAEATLLASARNDDREAYAALILRFVPPMTRTIRATLLKTRRFERTREHEVSDLLHEVCVRLWERGPRVLERCEPVSGLTLECLFRTVAQSVARSHLRSGRRSAWAEWPSDDEQLSKASVVRPEETLLARDRLRRLFGRSGDGRTCAIVHALYCEGRSLDEVCATFAVTRNAVYCAIRRFRESARALETQAGPRYSSVRRSEAGART